MFLKAEILEALEKCRLLTAVIGSKALPNLAVNEME